MFSVRLPSIYKRFIAPAICGMEYLLAVCRSFNSTTSLPVDHQLISSIYRQLCSSFPTSSSPSSFFIQRLIQFFSFTIPYFNGHFHNNSSRSTVFLSSFSSLLNYCSLFHICLFFSPFRLPHNSRSVCTENWPPILNHQCVLLCYWLSTICSCLLTVYLLMNLSYQSWQFAIAFHHSFSRHSEHICVPFAERIIPYLSDGIYRRLGGTSLVLFHSGTGQTDSARIG